MPYSPQEEALFKKYGVSPETHDLDRNTWTFKPKAPTDEGMVGTALRRAAGSALPTVASIPAMVKAGQLGAKIPGPPVVKGIGALAAGLGAGGAVGGGAAWLQNKAANLIDPELVEGWNEQEGVNTLANPGSDIVGGILPMVGPNKLNGIQNIARGVRALTSITKDPVGMEKLGQQGINAGIGAVQEAIHEFDKDKPLMSWTPKGIDPKKVAIAALGNAAFGDFRKSTGKLLSKIGVHVPNHDMPEPIDMSRDVIDNKELVRTVPESGATIDQQFVDVMDPMSSRRAVFMPIGTEYKGEIPKGLIEVKRPDGIMYVNEQKGGDVNKAATAEQAPMTELGGSKDVKEPGDNAVVTAENNGVEALTQTVNTTKPGEVPAAIAAAEAASPGAEVTVKDPAEVIADRQNEVRNQKKETIDVDDTDELDRRLAEMEAEEQASAGVKSDKPAADATPSPESPRGKISQAWYDLWRKLGYDKYGATTDMAGKITGNDGNGNTFAARGQYDPETRGVDVDTKIATNDTQPHELFHAWLIDVAENGTPGEKRYAKKLLETFGAEEPGVQATGEHVVERVRGDDGMMRDAMAFIKYKLGRATKADLARLGSNAILRGRGGIHESANPRATTGIRNQPAQDDRVFSTEFEKELRANPERPFKIQVAKDGRMSANDVRSALAKANPTELEMLRAAGIDEFLNKTVRPTPEELGNWIKEHGPQLEIKELDAHGTEQTEASAKLAQMQHEWFDNLPRDRQEAVRNAVQYGDDLPDSFPPELLDKANEYIRLSYIVDGTISPEAHNDSATARYTQVNPRELEEMPGAVDILVRIPKRKGFENTVGNSRDAGEAGIVYPASSSHYPQSGDNLLSHTRAYEHTLPDGRRVLRVFEQQSDWAQQRAKFEKDWPAITDLDNLPEGFRIYHGENYELTNKKTNDSVTADTREDLLKVYADERQLQINGNLQGQRTPNHPLLKHTNRLGLKAAIEIARKRGLDGVVIDDAETAMLTEGHDAIAGKTKSVTSDKLNSIYTPNEILAIFGDDWREGKYVTASNNIYRVDKPEVMKFRDAESVAMAKELAAYWQDPSLPKETQRQYIPQQGGMRFNYDQDLPRSMRDLTGNEGQPVELGEHKNAFRYGNQTEEARRSDPWFEEPRDNLIFRNPDGTPKTGSTGRFYPIDVPAKRRATGEPFSVAGKKYQPAEEEEFSGGADVEKLISILRNKQDRGDVERIAARELIQNSIDALKQSGVDKPTVGFGINTTDKTMMMVDNAKGMSPQFIVTKFLKMGYSSKGIGHGGGFGIAKGQFLGNADEFDIRSLWTDPNTGKRWLTRVTGDGAAFTKAQRPFKPNFTPDVDHVVPGGLKYRTEDVTGMYPDVEDGTAVKLKYDKAENLYEAKSAVDKSLSYNQDIKGTFLYEKGHSTIKSPLTDDTEYGLYTPLRDGDKDFGTVFDYRTHAYITPEYVKHDTVTAPGANIDIFSQKDSPVETGQWFSIPVLSNGIHQFDLSVQLPEEVVLPKMTVNIRPTVEGVHKDYPFAIDRSSVSDAVQQKIKDYFVNIGVREKNRRIDSYSKAKDNAPRMKIPGTENYRLLDTTQTIPPAFINEIATSPDMADVAHTLNNIHNVVRKTLGRRFPGQNLENAQFNGMFMGTENAYGVRFGKPDGKSPGEVYYDPFLLWNKARSDAGPDAPPDDVMARWLGQAVGVALHENLHQKINSEGESLARELTFTSGELAMAQDSITSAIEANIDNILYNKKLYDTLEHFYKESRAFADREKSSEFVSGVSAGFRMAEKPTETQRFQPDSTGDISRGTTDNELPEFEKPKTPIISSHVDMLRRSKNPEQKYVGDRIFEAHQERRELTGELGHKVMDAWAGASKAERNAAYDWLVEAERTETPGYPKDASPTVKKLVDSYREMYREVREKQNEYDMPVRDRNGNLRKGRMDPTGMAHLLDPETAYVLKNGQGTREWAKLVEDYKTLNRERLVAKHQFGRKNPLSDEAIESILDAKIRNFSGAEPTQGTPEWKRHSKALRLAEDTKLPKSWIDKDPLRSIQRYVDMVSRDLAWFHNIESDPRAAKLTGEVDTIDPVDVRRGNDNVSRAITDYVGGMDEPSKVERLADSVSNVATAGMTANPATRAKDLVGTVFRGAAHAKNPFQWPGMALDAVKAIASGTAKAGAKQTGLVQQRHNFMDNLIGNTERVRGFTRAVANQLSSKTGSEKLENESRYMAQAMGDSLVTIHGEAALRGDKTSRLFMEELAPTRWEELMKTDGGRRRLASRVAVAFQAAYNGQNLPSWALRGSVAPYARLMKWPIEQANNFRKFQLRPLMENNDPKPLAMYVATMLAGGLAVNEVGELITGRKSYTPTWRELEAGTDKQRVAANTAAKLTKAAEAVGMFGSYMWLMNAAAQALAGQQSPEINAPGASTIGNIGKHATAAGVAIAEGQDPLAVIPAAMDKIAQSQIAAYRILRNRTVDDREGQKRDMARDFTVEQLLNGKARRPYMPVVSYSGLDEREFDEAPLDEAGDKLTAILDRTDPEDYADKLKKLKSPNGRNIGPRMENMDKVMEYIEFIRQSQGDEAADRTMNALMEDDAERKMKRSMIP